MIRNRVLDKFNAAKWPWNMIADNIDSFKELDLSRNVDSEFKVLFDIILDKLNMRDICILKLKYINRKSNVEIGKTYQLTSQRILQIVNQIHRTLRKPIYQLMYYTFGIDCIKAVKCKLLLTYQVDDVNMSALCSVIEYLRYTKQMDLSSKDIYHEIMMNTKYTNFILSDKQLIIKNDETFMLGKPIIYDTTNLNDAIKLLQKMIDDLFEKQNTVILYIESDKYFLRSYVKTDIIFIIRKNKNKSEIRYITSDDKSLIEINLETNEWRLKDPITSDYINLETSLINYASEYKTTSTTAKYICDVIVARNGIEYMITTLPIMIHTLHPYTKTDYETFILPKSYMTVEKLMIILKENDIPSNARIVIDEDAKFLDDISGVLYNPKINKILLTHDDERYSESHEWRNLNEY